MERQSSVITEVENFIKRFHDGDSVVTPEAKKLVITFPSKKGILGLESKEQRYYADLLGWAIAAYQLHKDEANSEGRLMMAYQLLDYIERGRTHGVIKDNVKLIDKLKECQEENRELKETKIQLEAEILRQKGEIQELHKLVDQLGGKRTSTLEPEN